MNVLSLFDGMSCGQIALNRAGISYDTYMSSEIESNALTITKKNYPKTIFLGDVQKLIPSKFNLGVDLLLAGSPCQGFSAAGKNLNFNDPRSKLFFTYLRIFNTCNFKYFLFENVVPKSNSVTELISKELGVTPISLCSSIVSAQKRTRLYWTNIPLKKPLYYKNIFVKDILEPTVNKKYYLSSNKTAYLRLYSRSNFFLTPQSPKTGTIIASYAKNPSDAYYLKDDFGVRKFTPLEVERLQTVPENYTEGVADFWRYHMLGNGWTIDIISYILSNIK